MSIKFEVVYFLFCIILYQQQRSKTVVEMGRVLYSTDLYHLIYYKNMIVYFPARKVGWKPLFSAFIKVFCPSRRDKLWYSCVECIIHRFIFRLLVSGKRLWATGWKCRKMNSQHAYFLRIICMQCLKHQIESFKKFKLFWENTVQKYCSVPLNEPKTSILHRS